VLVLRPEKRRRRQHLDDALIDPVGSAWVSLLRKVAIQVVVLLVLVLLPDHVEALWRRGIE
jgi:hypothetical protein